MKLSIRLLLTWHEWREAVHDAECQRGFSSAEYRYHSTLREYHGRAAYRLARELRGLPV